ncbi:MAG: tyrosine-type recombinase/integrase [Planctomycetaceae bacterium]
MIEALLGSWMKRFLLQHLILDRNLSKNTQLSYRDTFRLLVLFMTDRIRKSNDQLLISHVTGDSVRAFLEYIETGRGCSVQTRNQRLAALHAFARFVGDHNPELIPWCREVRAVPFKRSHSTPVSYLEKNEVDAIIKSANRTTAQGRRNYAILLFLYNSGARASELVGVRINDIQPSQAGAGTVLLCGKGDKSRFCPLWSRTMEAIQPLLAKRPDSERLFHNRSNRPLTRFGLRYVVQRHAKLAEQVVPSLKNKRVSPHVIRHTTATHLLRSGVDINTIRAWLGHVSIETTNIYAEIDIQAKARALATCQIGDNNDSGKWSDDPDLMDFLNSL